MCLGIQLTDDDGSDDDDGDDDTDDDNDNFLDAYYVPVTFADFLPCEVVPVAPSVSCRFWEVKCQTLVLLSPSLYCVHFWTLPCMSCVLSDVYKSYPLPLPWPW